MKKEEKILSKFIDNLNGEKSPGKYSKKLKSPELSMIFETVRKVRSLKEPSMPDRAFSEALARKAYRTSGRRFTGLGSAEQRKRKSLKSWVIGAAAVTAMAVIVFFLQILSPFNTNVVFAMENAYQKVKAYHGVIDITEKNAEGSSAERERLEVWADKEGRYYVKVLQGTQTGLVTVNDGKRKWQLRPDTKRIYVFSAFPDPYRFIFELGGEIDDVKYALETKNSGNGIVAGRSADILEVTPKGGLSYRLWVDKGTGLPLQKESGMQNALQCIVTYSDIDFKDAIPPEYMNYDIPAGFREVDTDPVQIVNNMEEAEQASGLELRTPDSFAEGYGMDSIELVTGSKAVKLNYSQKDGSGRVAILEGKANGGLMPASRSILGKVDGTPAEVQSPIENMGGILSGSGPYAGVTDITSIRWQEKGMEYAVIGNKPANELVAFVEGISGGTVEIESVSMGTAPKPKVELPYDLATEENEQKSVDAGHSPWKLDPAFVAQVFVSLKISPSGITGDYPIKYSDIKIIMNDGKSATAMINDTMSPVKKVYLRRLVRQDPTGIWTVVGYDPT